MRFYDREKELKVLDKNWRMSSEHSFMTTLIGRRRVGKTSLLLKSCEGKDHLYLYVSKDSEPVLCQKFLQLTRQLPDCRIYGQPNSFGDLFEALMEYGKDHHFTLIIDEFQNLLSVNKAIPSVIQDIWDRQKDHSRVNLILCGSIYSMMKRIFENADEPLYGRRNSHLLLQPFTIDTLKRILADYNPHYFPDDLLCLFMLTGGVAKYVSLLLDAQASTKEKMLDCVFQEDSPFLTEGMELARSEFGLDYSVYFSIMQLIADGKTSQGDIDSVIGKNTGAYLQNLYREYHFISKKLPLLSNPGVRNIKWKIEDPFLRFWFRFVYPYQGLVESRQLGLLRKYVGENYDTFSGVTLEQFFHEKMMQSGQFTQVDNWWGKRGSNEIDMIALNEFNHTAVVAEIKRNPKRISMELLKQKTAALPPVFSKFQMRLLGLSLEDM